MVAERGAKKVSSLPFPAIVGQDELKRVLLAVAVDEDLDGALISGEKGTAKSTAVRSLVDVLPEQPTVTDCPYGCAPDDPSLQCADCRNREEPPVERRPPPLVPLPLGATRDRVVGTLSVGAAVDGEVEFDPGLLARAHRGILYVDEVNLLEDHLVDVILDAAASGINAVERDGVSVTHPASFTLIGTMNPEEGDLRPQLRDRFALRATVEGARDLDSRVEIIDRALESGRSDPDSDGDAVSAERAAEDVRALRERLAKAKTRLSEVAIPRERKVEVARLCLEAGVDGHRGDVATVRTARALAALDGRSTVNESTVLEAASYTLPHRLRSTPFEDAPDLEEILEEQFGGARDGDERSDSDEVDSDGSDPDEGDPTDESGGDRSRESADGVGDDGAAEDRHDGGRRSDADSPEDDGGRTPDANSSKDDGEERPMDGSTGTSRPRSLDDRSSGTTDGSDERDASDANDSSADPDTDDDATPLLPGQRRAGVGDATAPSLEGRRGARGESTSGSRTNAAPSVDNRGPRVRTEPASRDGPIDAAASVRSAAMRGRSRVDETDLRRSVRSGETQATIVFVVDASASMRPAMRAAKGVVFELLQDSYQSRDRIAFVAFAGDDADVLLPPTKSVSLAARHLKELPTGDRTPLSAGLETARSVLEHESSNAAIVLLVTDGKGNVAAGSPTEATRAAARRLAETVDEVLVVDAAEDPRHGLSDVIVAETGGERVSLSALTAERIRSITAQIPHDRE
ncbi:VWA domain-containing protein [Natrarchaeobius oligotrophus]|uniref:VWA domain-containing protein n=1 Tax=Natrarchaeobius chitinivorans TaxID=1679083 RepID=A0A3N6MKA2_NATCH|nr:VWA domain-containing protein [Natrarchaeobius chitinivorans]RQH01785.1 VWA domain-containing protein [Natrarchaeobius chitinivorans]